MFTWLLSQRINRSLPYMCPSGCPEDAPHRLRMPVSTLAHCKTVIPRISRGVGPVGPRQARSATTCAQKVTPARRPTWKSSFVLWAHHWNRGKTTLRSGRPSNNNNHPLLLPCSAWGVPVKGNANLRAKQIDKIHFFPNG